MKPVENQNRKLIYVDDQKDNLIVFEAQVSDSWQVKCYSNIAEALKEIKSFNPSIVLSDMRMGKVNGVEFLSQVKDLLPAAVRMIVTGFSGEDQIISSIRFAQVFDYVMKPYDHKDLDIRLEKALNQYEANLKANSDKHLLEKINGQLSAENAKLKEFIHTKKAELDTLKKEHDELKGILGNLAINKTPMKKAV